MISHFGRVQLFAALWTVARQAPPSREFSRQEHWSGLPCLSSRRGLPDPGIEFTSLTSPASAGRFFTTSATWESSSREELKVLLAEPLDSAVCPALIDLLLFSSIP